MQRPGRPPTQGITEALIEAAEVVMAAGGYSALSVEGLCGAVGTTRPTFYRRFPGVAHVALAVVVRRFGTGFVPNTESLLQDLVALQQEEIAMFSDPVMSGSLLGLLQAATRDAVLQQAYLTQFIGPRRENVGAVVRAAAARGEVVGELDAGDLDFACQLLLGPVLTRVLLPGQLPLDEALARRTAEAVVTVLSADPRH